MNNPLPVSAAAKTAPPHERRRHSPSLRASVRDGMSHAVMIGAGETYFGPFGIFLGATTMQIGLLATLPQLFGALLQWAGALATERIKSRRTTIVRAALFQASLLLPAALLPFVLGAGQDVVFVLILLVTLYQGAAGFLNPIWSSLIGDLVPATIRGRFFGRRSRLTGMSTFAALLIAGLILDLTKRLDYAALGFLVAFLGAMFGRLESARWLAKYDDPPFQIDRGQRFSFFQFIMRAPYSNFARYVFFVSTVNFAVAFSGPYFALYMLRDLQLSYLQFTAITAAAAVSQFLTFRYWGGLTDRFGNKKIMNVCGWGIGTVPILWLVSANIWYLIGVQVYGGFIWAGFTLASSNYLFDAVSPPKRARAAAYQGMINGAFVFAGSLLGGFVAIQLPRVYVAGPWLWAPQSVLLVIFLLSGLMRFVVAGVRLRRFKELRPVEAIRHRDLIFRISHIRPIWGARFSLVTGLWKDTPVEVRQDPDAGGEKPLEHS